MYMKKPEILAPAGSVKSAYAAINAGCDAVYIGGRKYGARAFADNPDNDTLASVIDDVHFYNKKIYVTVNTVFNNNDFNELYDFMKLIYEKGADAVIVQDIGVMSFIHKEFPDMPVHASTQMNIVQASAAELIKNYGVTRIIPARELSFAELLHMRKCTKLEIEVFVHGALCFSHSGQCLMSSLIGGRSGNKGACAQPCRKKYSFNPEGNNSGYLLSLKDLCTLEYIPELIGAGLDSFKIEGRMKKPAYVASAVHMYRKYVDSYFELGHDVYTGSDEIRKELKSDIKILQDIYNRGGFTCGYLTGNTDKDTMLSDKRPGHQGVKAGRVSDVILGKNTAELTFTEKTHPQDILEIRNRYGETIHVHTLKDKHGINEKLRINVGYNTDKILKGMEVFRVRNNELIENMLKRFPAEKKKPAIKGTFTAHEGEKISLNIKLKDLPDKCCTVYGDIACKAQKHAVTKQIIEDKIKVSGESVFIWDELHIEADNDIFISSGALKKLRREALKTLYEVIVKGHHRIFTDKKDSCIGVIKNSVSEKQELIAECRDKIQFECVNGIMQIDTIYMHMEDMNMQCITDMLSGADKPVYLVMPRIFRLCGQDYFEREYDMDTITSYPNFNGMVVCSLEELAWLKNKGFADRLDIRAADNLYARNIYSQKLLRELGVSVCQAPAEMTHKELLSAAEYDYDVAIYKRNTAMVTAICLSGHDKIYDSYGNTYPVIRHERFGYTEIMHYETTDYTDKIPVRLFNRIRLSFYDEKPSEIKRIVKSLKEKTG